ncbi:phosphatase PAP2 family protein [Martelella sp.]|uniref:phosphatase PAP2 family protein n=3 Tax=unclassified Martelella TaxID=2629616 RepID=UPI0025BC56AC|nr:phosphatase PAP2 family protein [Martelella sp.]
MNETREDLPKTGIRMPPLFWKRRVAHETFRLSATCWPWFLLPAATLALLCMATLDGPVASARDAMSSRFQDFAARLTDVTTAPWILGASGTVTVLAYVAIACLASPRVKFRAALVLHQGFYLFCSVALASATVNVVKRLIGRARPTLFDTVGDLHFNVGVWAYDYASFPSGHSTTSGAIFAGLALLYPRLGPFFAAFAIFFGFARIAVGAHYPSDVSAGLFYGTWISVLVACVFARYRLLFAVPERGLPVRRPHPRLRDRLRS